MTVRDRAELCDECAVARCEQPHARLCGSVRPPMGTLPRVRTVAANIDSLAQSRPKPRGRTVSESRGIA